MKMLWVAVVLSTMHSCDRGDVYIGTGPFVFDTEAGCLTQAEKTKKHMMESGHPVQVRCDKLPLVESAN